MQLPVADGASDAAVMALVLFFVPEPAVGVAEMCRAVRSGGVVAAYHWDMLGGGFPLADIGAEMLKFGIQPRMPPSVTASTLDASTALWQEAGLLQVRSCADHCAASLRKLRRLLGQRRDQQHASPDVRGRDGGASRVAEVQRAPPAAGRRWPAHRQRAGECSLWHQALTRRAHLAQEMPAGSPQGSVQLDSVRSTSALDRCRPSRVSWRMTDVLRDRPALSRPSCLTSLSRRPCVRHRPGRSE